MLRFLGKIRKSLIESGGAGKPVLRGVERYLFYALGEIALVVIGILIAMQINNWNQGITEKKELHSYLATIKGNLESDIESLEEIKLFRDSSMAYSRRWLMLAKKESITPLDLLKQEESPYGVFVDNYFQPRNSGFEALKTSGLIGKLNGTILEGKLNNYYYLIDKIRESETSLNPLYALENESGGFRTSKFVKKCSRKCLLLPSADNFKILFLLLFTNTAITL